MSKSISNIATVDDYIASYESESQQRLLQLRKLITTLCPDAVENISYGMPAYKLHKKPLIYFAAFTHHIGLYATPSGHSAFAKELAGYKQGKGSVQFPLDQALPIDLIENIVKFNMKEIV